VLGYLQYILTKSAA